jgi:hypothetical protein
MKYLYPDEQTNYFAGVVAGSGLLLAHGTFAFLCSTFPFNKNNNDDSQ